MFPFCGIVFVFINSQLAETARGRPTWRRRQNINDEGLGGKGTKTRNITCTKPRNLRIGAYRVEGIVIIRERTAPGRGTEKRAESAQEIQTHFIDGRALERMAEGTKDIVWRNRRDSQL